MALPTRPLSIKDVCTTARSIAQEVDGNLTGDKTLTTLGISAGISTPDYAMSEFEGYSSSKSVNYCRISSIGSCGTVGPVSVCSCLVNNPIMTSGELYDACFCWRICADNYARSKSCVDIKCNGIIIMSCINTTSTLYSGLYNVVSVDYNDAITMCVYATSDLNFFGSQSCAYTCLHGLTNMTGSFVIGSPNDEIAFAIT